MSWVFHLEPVMTSLTAGVALSSRALAATGPVMTQGLGMLAIAIGIMLWLMGKRLARPACAGVWVIVGMTIASAVCQALGDGGLLPLWLIAGGIVAGAMGWLLYRVCLAMALGLVLGLTVPAVVHLTQHGLSQTAAEVTSAWPEPGTVDPQTPADVATTSDASAGKTLSKEASEQTEKLVDAVKDKTAATTQAVSDAIKEAILKTRSQIADKIAGRSETHPATAADEPLTEREASHHPAPISKHHASAEAHKTHQDKADEAAATTSSTPTANNVLATFTQLARGPWEQLKAWWNDLSPDSHKTMLGAACIGGLCGFILGLIFPRLGAAAGSSLLGTLFMATGGVSLLSYYNPSLLQQAGNQTSLCLTVLGLITLMGIGIQWTLERRRADN